jgi:hypothetical protein
LNVKWARGIKAVSARLTLTDIGRPAACRRVRDLDDNHWMIGSLSLVGQKEPKNKKFRVITIPPSALKSLRLTARG